MDVTVECPMCLPEGMETRYMELKLCFRHRPKTDGSDDALASLLAGELQFSGTAESSGETNRAFAKWQKNLRKKLRRARRK